MANIWQASKEGNITTVKELVASGVNINEKEAIINSTPLHYAAKHGKSEVVNWLITNGADINAKDADGNTALLLACIAKEESICVFLIEHGAKSRIKNNKGEDVLDKATLISSSFLQKVTSTVNEFQRQQSNLLTEIPSHGFVLSDDEFNRITSIIERANLGKMQPFYKIPRDDEEIRQNWRVFTKYGLDEYIKKMMAKKMIPIDDENEKHETALIVAAKYAQQEVCTTLIKAGSNVNHVAHGGTPLIWCCKSLVGSKFMPPNFAEFEPASTACAEFLIRKGANVNTQNEEGETPLHWAIERNAKSIIRLLINCGADTTKKDKKGKTPRDWIKSKDLEDVYKEIIEKSTTTKQLDNPDLPDIMISFNVRTARDLAVALKEKLHQHGYSTWLCLDMDVGSNFRSEIVLAATSSKIIIPLINEGWANSKECQYEINIAQRNF